MEKNTQITIVKNQMTEAIYERFHEHLQPCPNRPFGKGFVNTLKSVQLKVLNNNPKILWSLSQKLYKHTRLNAF
jgi:hypothetical protein